MELYCRKCKSNTASENVKTVKTKNNRLLAVSNCKVCGSVKNTFIKEPPEVLEAKELHKPVIKKFIKRRIVTKGIDDLWAADLLIMKQFAKQNKWYKYILNVIDTFSKFVWSEPLKTKDGIEVTKAFENIIKRAINDNHNTPKLLHCDKGTEFKNKQFNAMLKKYDIKMYHTESEEKSAIVERFHRTLNQKLKIKFQVRNSYKWYDILQELIDEYNKHDFHRTIKMRPIDVTKKNEAQILEMYNSIEKEIPRKTPKFNIGDRVRITAKKDVFTNKYKQNWTSEIFIITQVSNTRPVTYKIKDQNGEEIVGSFYEKELQKTEF